MLAINSELLSDYVKESGIRGFITEMCLALSGAVLDTGSILAVVWLQCKIYLIKLRNCMIYDVQETLKRQKLCKKFGKNLFHASALPGRGLFFIAVFIYLYVQAMLLAEPMKS